MISERSKSLLLYLGGIASYSPTPISYYFFFQKAIENPADISNQTWFDLHEAELGVPLLISILLFMYSFEKLKAPSDTRVFLHFSLFLAMMFGIPNISYVPTQNPGWIAWYARDFLSVSVILLILNGCLYGLAQTKLRHQERKR